VLEIVRVPTHKNQVQIAMLAPRVPHTLATRTNSENDVKRATIQTLRDTISVTQSTSFDKDILAYIAQFRLRFGLIRMPQHGLAPGQIVLLRSRLWRVDDLNGDIMTATSIEGTPVQTRRFYLPVEDVTPAKIPPPTSEIIGNFSAQDLVIRSFKLSMIHGTAPLLSLQRSRVVPELFQMVPVVMSLDMPRVRMLIADDVGLGKTIEAGLILSELFARQRAHKLLVVCPASLREQWAEALDYFFHIKARIISSQHIRKMERELPPGTNPWEYFPHLIVSMDYAKTAQVTAQIIEQQWDVAIVDEAHNVAKPHQIDAKAKVQMDRWEFARELAPRSTHLLLLTATPHNGFTDCFASLLQMLDVGAVSGPAHDPTINREVAKKYVCQRRRKDVEEEFKRLGEQQSPFPNRDPREVYVTPNNIERKTVDKLEALGKHILDSAGSDKPFKLHIAKWTVTHLHKRALSSPRALVISLQNRLKVVDSKLGIRTSQEDEFAIKEDEARATVLDNDTGERLNEEEAGVRLDRSVFGGSTALETERKMVDEVLREAQKLTPSNDSKLNWLLDNTLRELLRRRPKALIFSKYRDTVDYLAHQIPLHRNYRDLANSIITIDGSLDEAERKERFRRFASLPKAVLIATDAISEGINLQYLASQIVHYELPWNPNRLEQRNGRVDRYGQPEATVVIRTMVVDDSLEAAILKVLVEKANRIRQDRGFSPPFFGDDISVLDLIREQGLEVSIANTKLDDFLENTTPKKNIPNPFSDESIKKIENENFYGQAQIDLSEVRRRLKETESVVGSQSEIQKFVRSGLDKFRCEVTPNQDGTFKIFIKDQRLLNGLSGATIHKASFDALRSRGDTDVDIIDLGHPLVQNLIELVKDLSFASTEFYGRTAAIRTLGVSRMTALYTCLARFAVHTTPVSVIEELLPVGLEIQSGRLLSTDQLRKLGNSSPILDQRSQTELREDISQVLSLPDLERTIQNSAKVRCDELIAERQRVRKSLEEQEKREWLSGMDQLSVASTDLLCVTLCYPGVH